MATEERTDKRRYRTTDDGDYHVIYDRENERAWVASTYTVEIG
jgi:hypothetical protein